MKMYKLSLPVILMLTLLLGWACSSDMGITPDVNDLGGGSSTDDTYLTLSINVPSPATRSAAGQDDDASSDGAEIESIEEKLHTVDVVVFEKQDQHEIFAYATRGTSIKATSEANLKTFEAKIKKSEQGEQYRLVILANAHEALQRVLENMKKEQLTKQELLELIYVEMDTSTHLSVPSRGIPMWGESNSTQVITKNTTGPMIGRIHLLRSMASIGIYPADGLTNFKIKEAYVYNPVSKALVAPRMILKNGKWVVEKPSLPSDLSEVESDAESTYPRFHYVVPEGSNMLEQQIYLPEAINDGKEHLEKVCLVVGGIYGENNDQISWYRVDLDDYLLQKNDPNSTTSNIVRNYFYQITINSVKSSGFSDPDIAFEAEGTSMEAQVKSWNLEEIDNLVFDGTYYLTINPKKMAFDSHNNAIVDGQGDGLENCILVVDTDYPASVVITPLDENKNNFTYSNPAWLKAELEESGQNHFRVSITKDLANKSNRKAYLKVSLGHNRLSTYVEVTQSKEYDEKVWIKIEVSDGSKWKEASTGYINPVTPDPDAETAVKYRVSWGPKGNDKVSNDLYIKHNSPGTAGQKSIKWRNTGVSYDNPLTGEHINGVQGNPDKQIFFEETDNAYIVEQRLAAYSLEEGVDMLTDQYVYMVDYNGQAVSKTLNFVQAKSTAEITVVEDYVLLDGMAKGINVKSSVPWRLYVTKNNVIEGLNAIGTRQRIVYTIAGQNVECIKEDEEAISILEGDANYPMGQTFTFVPVDDINQTKTVVGNRNIIENLNAGELHLELRSKTDKQENEVKLASKSFVLSAGRAQDGLEANCYILNPSSQLGVMIPVRAANGAMTDRESGGDLIKPGGHSPSSTVIGTVTKLLPKLVWTDVEMWGGGVMRYESKDKFSPAIHYPRQNLIKYVGIVGKGSNAHLLVRLGEAAKQGGNAVVAVTDSVGKILWSWHIWVTDIPYMSGQPLKGVVSPNLGDATASWLDRDLGALASEPVDPNSLNSNKYTANYYQWGRKDPFPAEVDLPTNSNSNYKKSYYDIPAHIGLEASIGSSLGEVKTASRVKLITSRVESVVSSIFTPHYFYYHKPTIGGVLDPQKNHWAADGSNADLWWHGTTKTIYDPCPAGYRVPTSENTFLMTDIDGQGAHDTKKGQPDRWVDYPNKDNASGRVEQYVNFYPFLGVMKRDVDKLVTTDIKSSPRWQSDNAGKKGKEYGRATYFTEVKKGGIWGDFWGTSEYVNAVLEEDLPKQYGLPVRCVRSGSHIIKK